MKPKKKRTLLILGAILAFFISLVLTLVFIGAIEINEAREGYVTAQIGLLQAFLFIVASGFFVDTVSVKTRKISPRTAFIWTALLLSVIVFIYKFTIVFTTDVICRDIKHGNLYNYKSTNLSLYDGALIIYLLFAYVFGFSIGLFLSKLVATMPKGARRTVIVNDSQVIDIQPELKDDQPQRNSEDIIIAEPKKAVPKKKKEKKLSYLEEYKKEMYNNR